MSNSKQHTSLQQAVRVERGISLERRIRVERAVANRRRDERFRTLRAIAELVRLNADVDGHATGTLKTHDISVRGGVSHGAVKRALAFWSRQRVLCSRREDSAGMIQEIKFERAVIEGILGALARDPSKVKLLIAAHRAKREAIAPWPRVPKSTTGAETKELEVMATPGVQ